MRRTYFSIYFKNVFSWHCFTQIFSKTTAPQQLIFQGTLSTIIIFKRCKFSVNLWTLCYVLQKVPKALCETRPQVGPSARLARNSRDAVHSWKRHDLRSLPGEFWEHRVCVVKMKDNFPYGATTFSLFFLQKGISYWGKIRYCYFISNQKVVAWYGNFSGHLFVRLYTEK